MNETKKPGRSDQAFVLNTIFTQRGRRATRQHSVSKVLFVILWVITDYSKGRASEQSSIAYGRPLFIAGGLDMSRPRFKWLPNRAGHWDSVHTQFVT